MRRLKALGRDVRCVYEAGPCGYEPQRALAAARIACAVAAPSLIPRRPGDRVKTDRRDADKLGRLYRAGELTLVTIPDQGQEALRDLIRAQEDAKVDLLRRRHRLGKFLLPAPSQVPPPASPRQTPHTGRRRRRQRTGRLHLGNRTGGLIPSMQPNPVTSSGMNLSQWLRKENPRALPCGTATVTRV